MNFKVNTSNNAIQESGSSYIAKSGIYDVTIDFASIAVSSGGAESINFNLDYNGNKQTIYGPYVTDKAGNTLEIGAKLINKLAIITGMTDGDDFQVEQEEHAVGKDNKPQEFAVITNFSDLPIKIRLQEEYAINPKTQEIRKSLVIKSFFRADGASAEEIVNDSEVGKRLTLETEKYADNITYRDNLTAEDIENWKQSKSSGTPTPTKKAAPAVNKPSGSLFK